MNYYYLIIFKPASEDTEKNRTLIYIASRNVKWYTATQKTDWQFLLRLTMHFPCDPAIALWSLYPEKRKLVHTKVYADIFVVIWSAIAQNSKQPKCSPRGAWLDKLGYLRDMEHYSELKRHELLLLGTIWVDFKEIMFGEKADHFKKLHTV